MGRYRRLLLVLLAALVGLWLALRYVQPELLRMAENAATRPWLLVVALVCLVVWGYALAVHAHWWRK